MMFFQKISHKISICPSNSVPRYKELKTGVQRKTYTQIFIAVMEIIQMSINSLDKQKCGTSMQCKAIWQWKRHKWYLLQHGWSSEIFAKWKRQDTEELHSVDSFCMKCPEKAKLQRWMQVCGSPNLGWV